MRRALRWDLERKRVMSGIDTQGLIPHDFRRSAARNLVNSGVDIPTAMKVTGHKTLHIFLRYNIISTEQLHEAMAKVTAQNKAAK